MSEIIDSSRRHPSLSREMQILERLFSFSRPRALGMMAGAVVACGAPRLLAQTTPTGRIVGRVIDAQSGDPLSDAGIQVVGTTLGATSGVDGRFTLLSVPAGTVTIQARRIGYGPKTVTGIVLDAGATIEQNVALAAATIRLQTQTVTAAAERGTASEALDR